jgi:hypothetical protein
MHLSIQPVSSEEREQILQTVEMFEIIVQASPHDCQSMEILKEAYLKLGRADDALGVARRLAAAYAELGQYSQAVFEYEAILHRDPANPEVIAALSALEDKLANPAQAQAEQALEGSGLGGVIRPPQDILEVEGVDLDVSAQHSESGTLITTDQTQRGDTISAPQILTPEAMAYSSDGLDALAKFLNQHRLAPEDVIASALERVIKKNADRKPGTIPVSLLDEVCRRGSIELEALLCGIVDRSRYAYIPLEYYDVDRTVVRMLPEHLTIGRLIVPFDVMSRTVMLATANPFDASAKETAQQLLDYNIQWHIAAPQAIAQVLATTYKVGSAGPETIAFRLST